MKKILITGGAGFIGSNFILFLLESSDDTIVYNLDKLTYAGDLERLRDIASDRRYHFIEGDICNENIVQDIFSKGIDAVVHFAAESHVDRSIQDSIPFAVTNVRGTLTLLNAARKFGIDRFIHISTDEVYGQLGEDGQFFETTPLNPNSPYSASKAAADLFVKAYLHTYKLPAIIARPSNNYGPLQYPEKLIPVVIGSAIDNKPVPVYAKGENVREWIYVEDCVEGIFAVLEKGRIGEVYNIGSGRERRNIEVVRKILSILGKSETLIEYVQDRPGHDFRYSLNTDKMKTELGFKARTDFDDGLEKTVRWYTQNEGWWRRLLSLQA
jgi:dTDP-glucose 4,6-dehydratase